MAITEEQYNAAVELQKRGRLAPQQAAAAAEIINRYSPSASQSTRAEQDVRRTALLGPEQKASPIPYETSSIGATAGSLGGSLALEVPGATAGRVVGGVLGGVLTRTPAGIQAGSNLGAFGGAIVASAVGAGAGGVAGDLAERMASGLYRDDDTMTDAFNMAVNAGEKEAAYDLIGGLIFRGAPVAFRKIVGGPMQPGAEEAQKMLNKQGTGLALDQAVSRAILDEVSGALRGSRFSRGPFDILNQAQDKAVIDFYDDFVSSYAGAAREVLTEEGTGKLILDTLKSGENVFDAATADMFSALDRALVLRSSRPTTLSVEVSPAIAGVKDKTVRDVPAQAFEKPVDVSAVRERAKNLVSDIKEVGDVDPKAEGTSLLANIAGGASRLTFAQTHTLISDLKRLQRSGRLKGLPAESKVGDFIGLLQNSFDSAGKQLPDNLAQQYAKMRAFTRFGKQKFESDFIAKLMDNESIDAYAVSNMVVNASPGDVVRLRQTMRLADRFKGAPAGSSWRTVQGAMLDRVLPQNVEQIGNAPIFKIKTDRELQAQMKKVFSETELSTIYRNVDLINKVVLNRPGTGALSGRQAGAVFGGLYGLGGAALGMGSYQDGMTTGNATAIGAYLVAPKFLSKAIASPKLTAALASWDNAMRVTGPSKGNALVKATRLIEQVYQESQENAEQTPRQ